MATTIDETELRNLVDSGRGTTKIAETLGCHTSTVTRALREYGISLQSRYKHTDNEVRAAAQAATSVTGVMVNLGMKPHGFNHSRFRLRLRRLGIVYDSKAIIRNNLSIPRNKKRVLQDYLVYGGPVITTAGLRKWLIREGRKDNKCEACGVTEWLGVPIVCQLDHIDGNRRDNRIENLRILCPNCHSLTSTHSKRKTGKITPEQLELAADKIGAMDQAEFNRLFGGTSGITPAMSALERAILGGSDE